MKTKSLLMIFSCAVVVWASARDFSIASFGAKTDGGDCAGAIRDAVAACSAAGGGRVVVPPGRWTTGAVHLKSNVELHLSDGATLAFTDNVSDYLPAVPVSWEGVECLNLSPLVYAYGATNVAITGHGVLSAKVDFWRKWDAQPRDEKAQAAWNKLVFEWGGGGVRVDERNLSELPGAKFRPQFIHFNRCEGVRLEDFSMRGSPFWCVHLFNSRSLRMKGVDVSAVPEDDSLPLRNTDGVDVESCTDVVISSCSFCQGDDAIVIKSGRNEDGRRLGVPTDGVLVEDCIVNRGHVLLGIGSELSGGVRNVKMRNCRVEGEATRLFFVKTNRHRGGFVENISMENVYADIVAREVLSVITSYPGEKGMPVPEGLPPTRICGLSISNVVCKTAGAVANVWGDPISPICGVRMNRVEVGKISGGGDPADINAVSIENACNVVVDGIHIGNAPKRQLRLEHW